MIRRTLILLGTGLSLLALIASPSLADHGEGHNGETLELSNAEEIENGEVVTVTLTSWLPGKTATIVTCFVYPAAGPSDCELSNYGQHTAVIDADGNGTLEYPVAIVPGKCDHENPCLIVAGDGFGPTANYAAQTVTFSDAPIEETTTTTAAPTTTEATTTTAAPTTEAPTTAAPATEPADDESAAEVGDDDDDGGTPGWLIPVLVIGVVAGAGGAVMSRRNKA